MGMVMCGFAIGMAPGGLMAQATPPAQTGPVIADYGAVYTVSDPDFPTPRDRQLRVVFDVSTAPDSVSAINPRIETVARFLNMHAQAGVPVANLDVALVLHGGSGKYALSDAAYRARFGTANPNLPLLRALHAHGVRIILCGQTAAHRGFSRAELAEPVELALSAMTALVTLQNAGYALIRF